MARGEASERSDVDLLVLHDGCGEDDLVWLRRRLYLALREALGDEVEGLTVIDVRLEDFLSPRQVTSLLLNIYWDGIVLYDVTGKLQGFLEEVIRGGLRLVALRGSRTVKPTIGSYLSR